MSINSLLSGIVYNSTAELGRTGYMRPVENTIPTTTGVAPGAFGEGAYGEYSAGSVITAASSAVAVPGSGAIYGRNTQKTYQEFYLPDDFVRGTDTIPPISGLQVMCSIEAGYAASAAIDYAIDWYGPGGWAQLVKGTELGAHVDGSKVWFDIFLKEPLFINSSMLADKFRFSVGAHAPPEAINQAKVRRSADGRTFSVYDYGFNLVFNSRFYPGRVMPVFRSPYGAGYAFWDADADEIYFTSYYGIRGFWYTHSPWRSYYINEFSEEVYNQEDAKNVQLHFRLLAGVADSGKDIIGNDQRQVVTIKDTSNLDPFVDKGPNDFWKSKPNPSKFAVECLYFDIRSLGKAQVIDKVNIDPITNGIYFTIYYSNEGDEPGFDEDSWEQKLWSRVPRTYHLDKKDTFVFPEPITAKYVCVEFTHLKPELYDPGETTFPITYKKHPKWVLDYFLSRLETDTTADKFVASRVNIAFDALDLAYNYFLDDLKQSPESPVRLLPGENSNRLTQFLTDRKDTSDLVDSKTLAQIKLAFDRYKRHPASNGPLDYIYTEYGPGGGNNYAVEVGTPTPAVSSDVSTLSRESLIIEQNFPVMFFYVPSRHTYREVSADLRYNRAYFAGVREIAFLRETYSVQYDGEMYIEGVGDQNNVGRNDFFTTESFSWITHPE